jgi:uncharacterized protein with HEPN domain
VPSEHDPADSLAGIVDNAERVHGYLARMDQHSFERDGMARDAVERCLEPVCEAVYRLGPRAETLIPGQPWADIRGMANRLRHAYDRISLTVIWNAARYDLPALETAARHALTTLEGGAPTA